MPIGAAARWRPESRCREIDGRVLELGCSTGLQDTRELSRLAGESALSGDLSTRSGNRSRVIR
jgi:hypothetical protein